MVHAMIDSLNMEQVKIESLKTTLIRKRMKVPIFGPTSGGKSMVINAMVGKELLPSSMGHTTNCFLQIEEARDDDAACDPNVPREGARLPSFSEVGSHFIIRRSQFATESTTNAAMSYEENSIIPLDIPLLHDLSDAKADQPLDICRYVEIFLAKDDHKCPLLTHFLQILDCPGISMCREMGDKVKAFCEDADVHVLIVNTMSGISAETKEHFLKVKERLPNPDIIIGFTVWDMVDNERPERKEKVKRGHLTDAFGLLKSTGTVSTMEEAKERCFFISGREALSDALGEQSIYSMSLL
ncbi:transmembrane GTPase fzo-like [Strongylocentrotus purpuratus]|uniref:Dynamin N-terminal domain-containing protein n=1 Tax=Strongylocentrotus purpuratus TaxID=7668 RepID=A0A7M7N2T2_STRPU|nr:transmembrane GTPase fzo-like [Strongylocentrotus purpuratus]